MNFREFTIFFSNGSLASVALWLWLWLLGSPLWLLVLAALVAAVTAMCCLVCAIAHYVASGIRSATAEERNFSEEPPVK